MSLTLILDRIRVFNRRLNIIEQRLRALENPVPKITTTPPPRNLMTEGEDVVFLYLEAHVTIEPVFDERRAEAAAIAEKFNFKLADLLMKKRAEDTEERSSKDTFMTGHSKSKADINSRTADLVMALRAAQFKVWRYKIEDTLLDSRYNDVWGMLS